MIIKYQKKIKAFSYNEVIMVSLLMAVLLLVVSPFLLSAIKREGFNDTEMRIIDLIKNARRRSLEEYKNLTWAVCYSDNLVFVSDSECTLGNIASRYEIPEGVIVDDFDKIEFSKITGETSDLKIITISAFNETKSIHINQAGGYYVE